jgi:hypothetical protein
VVRLPDGSGERLPLQLTDAVGVEATGRPACRLTAESLLELAALVEALDRPHCS